MSRALPEDIEIGPRLYLVKLVDAYAWEYDGGRCHIDHTEQTIYLNGAFPEEELAEVLSRAVRHVLCRCYPGWRMIPMVGKIS